MDGKSQTPQEERIGILRSLMPEIFDEGKIDWEKLKATLGEEVNFSNERYVLNWAGKSDAFRVMQQPSVATLVPCSDESVDFDNTRNIFIEGENMEVLKVLQKSYFGRVKMIYIDPPYNTGNDSFIYPDRFSVSRDEYLRRVGDKDEEGFMTREGMFRRNSRENGQYHSNWLNMMMPRLYLAKSLMREDGVIFISIDDNEVHNLRLLMNEIFGEENFIGQFVWKKKQGGGNDSSLVVVEHEYILCFAKYIENISFNLDKTHQLSDNLYPFSDANGDYGLITLDKASIQFSPSLVFEIKDPEGNTYMPRIVKGKQSCWRWGKTKVEAEYDNLVFKNGKVYTKYYRPCGVVPKSLLVDSQYGRTESGNDDIKTLFGKAPFSYPKPVSLIKHFISISTDEDDIILDFFAGSGTTAQAVMEMNMGRQFICVQMPEPCDEKSEAYKAGYKNIADISKERIRRAGAKILTKIEQEQAQQKEELDLDYEKPTTMPDLGFKVFRLSDSNFKQWREIRGSDKEAWKQQMLDFLDPVAENATIGNMVYELLLKTGKSLNSTIVHTDGCYIINGGELALMLESASQETINAILTGKPQKVIALDSLFEGNDQMKTNTALQMRDAGIDFRTI